MSRRSVRIAVYGEINMNLIDGSSVWLQSVALMLTSLPDVHVTVLLRAPVERDLLVAPMRERARLDVVDAATGVLSAPRAVHVLAELDRKARFDLILLRGPSVTEAAVDHGGFDGRIWLYYVPSHGSEPEDDADSLRRWAVVSSRILCQTEGIRNRVVATVPELAERAILLPPMIPPLAGDEASARPAEGSLRRLLYAGKLSPEYCFLEMVDLLTRLRRRAPEVELHVAGDKIHNPRHDPSFKPAAEAALRETPGLMWHGPLPRAQVLALLRSADVALSLRDPSMDASAELSTKVLEYGAAGCPVVLNRSPAHVETLGGDYPLLASDVDEALEALVAVDRDAALRAEAARRCLEASRPFTFDRVATELEPHLRAQPVADAGAGSPRLLVAGHSFQFFGDVAVRARTGGAALREDRWLNHAEHDEEASHAALAWAEVVHCEWCMGNAVWYSRHKRPGQRLVVRFHRMELETELPAGVDLDRVDAMVFVARHVLDQACESYGWAADDPRLHVIPNAIELDRLRLPKLPESDHALGLVGYVPMLKRLDRALDILERVRAHDDRFRLIIKGRAPWELSWVGARDEERRYFEDAFRRIEHSPGLRRAVTFEPYGDDVAEFLQQVGWVLSLSDVEGHAVGLAEGMASGAVPVVVERAGARDQYLEDWVHANTDAAARAILAVASGSGAPAEGDRAARYAERWGWERIAPSWGELLGLPAASFPPSPTAAR